MVRDVSYYREDISHKSFAVTSLVEVLLELELAGVLWRRGDSSSISGDSSSIVEVRNGANCNVRPGWK